jgi:lipid A ethanolaminephosphotransferase
VSLPCLFSPDGRATFDAVRTRRSESLLHVLDHAGVATRWRDNQSGCKGVCAGLPFESTAAAHAFDDILLEGLDEAIAAQTGDAVFVLHPLGNHGPAYWRRYPDGFRRFVPDCRTVELGDCTREEIVNAYDNAVLYGDHVVASVIDVLQAQARHDTALLYVSDHGESLGEAGLYLHGLPYAIAPRTQTRVPMVAWLSPGFVDANGLDIACLRRIAGEPASHDNVFDSVLGLMRVATSVYTPRRDLFARCATRQSAEWSG